jgi:hypothetical protein
MLDHPQVCSLPTPVDAIHQGQLAWLIEEAVILNDLSIEAYPQKIFRIGFAMN